MRGKKTILITICMVLFFGLWLAMKDSPEQGRVPTAMVKKGDLELAIKSSGRLEAVRSRSVIPNLPGDKGKIVWIIQDGTVVKPGDVLVRFDATHFEEEVRKLQSKLETQQSVLESYVQAAAWEESQAEREINSMEFETKVAAMDLEQLKNGDGPLEIAQRQEDLNEARRTFQETQGYTQDLTRLVEKGLVEEIELLQAQEDLQTAQLRLKVAEQKFKSFEEFVFPAKLNRSRAQLERSRLAFEEMKKAAGFRIGKARAKAEEARQHEAHFREQLKKAKRLLTDTVLIAPQKGLVVLVEKHVSGELRKPRVGDVAWQGQPIIHLPDLSEMTVKTQVREIDLHRVKLAQKVQVSVDAFPDLLLAGKIDHIGILAQRQLERQKKEKVFNLLIQLNGHDDRLRPGMNVRVEIVSDSKKEILLVPLSAVFGKGKGRWCYVQEGESWEKREIMVGLTGDMQAEIKEGLEDGEVVALIQPTGM